MQFRLIYQGPLHAQSSSSAPIEEKHKIRKVLHKQPRSLTTWDTAITWEMSAENVQRAANEVRTLYSSVALNETFV
jgi:hypothetical protein